MGRYSHPKYTDGKQILAIYEKYKQGRQELGLPLESAGVLVALGISANTWDEYSNYSVDSKDISESERSKYIERSEVLKKIESECTQSLIEWGMKNPKSQGLTVFLLKQKRNGGYTDKQEVLTTGDVNISVKLTDSSGKTI